MQEQFPKRYSSNYQGAHFRLTYSPGVVVAYPRETQEMVLDAMSYQMNQRSQY